MINKDVSVMTKLAPELWAVGAGGGASGIATVQQMGDRTITFFDYPFFGTIMTWGEFVSTGGFVVALAGLVLGILKYIDIKKK